MRCGRARRRQDPVDESEKRPGEVLRSQTIDRGELAIDDAILQSGVRDDLVHQRGDMDRIAILEQHASAIHGGGHRGGGVGQHRHLLVKRLDDRNAEAFVFAGAEKQIGRLVEGHQLFVRDMTDEMHLRDTETADQLVQRRQIAFESRLRTHEQEPGSRIEDGVVRVEPADHILNLLVGDHAPDENDIRPVVVEIASDEPVRLAIEVREVWNDRQHRGSRESQRLEILPIEFRVAHRQVAAIRVRLQFPPASKRLPGQPAVDSDEVLRRGDVVVDERHPIRQGVGGARGLRPERKMMEQQVVAMAEVHELAVVACLRLEPVIRGLDEDFRFVSGGTKHALDAQHLVADRVAVPQRGEDLVNPDHPRLHAGPFGSFAMTSWAAGKSCRLRSNQPGAGSAPGAGESFFSRSNISRYFRSMTGQS